MPFYAVAKGREVGVFGTWDQCRAQVHGFAGPIYRKFDTRKEAEDFVADHSSSTSTTMHCGRKSYFAVIKGREQGIYESWQECRPHVQGVPDAMYKKFTNRADAEQYLSSGLDLLLDSPSSKQSCFDEESRPDVLTVYTDGACSKNGFAGAAAGLGVYFGENDPRNTAKRVLGDKQTNNVAELLAVITAIDIITNDIGDYTKIYIYTDSQYVIKCATTYGKKVFEKKVGPEIPNHALVLQLYGLMKKINAAGTKLELCYVRGHTKNMDAHSIGNRHADALAVSALD